MSSAVEATQGKTTTAGNDVLPNATRKSSSGAWRRFRHHHLAMVGVVILTLLTVTAVAAPLIAQNDPYRTNISQYRKGPSEGRILGSDGSGRDVLSRLLHAGRISLSVGLVAVSIYTLIGIILGAFAGYYGGRVDSIIMRMADVVLAFPSLIIIITIVSFLGPSVWNIMMVIGLLGWPPMARILRGQFLSLREQEFVVASRAIGAPNRTIIFRHMLPNALAPIIVAATFGIASAILLEAGLSFLGLGVQPPTPTWGNMLSDAQSLPVLQSMPWLWLPPGVMIALAVLSINFIGDGLRDAFDPHLHHR
ncbi:MAG: peptide/nickel transport system permease protein [Thermomicrobiales bacterium]|nr:peptide/nickel transport system permease protein [Thermomicrobiales bacterium]MEA2529574.1 peptide/nickel transport system permease protein [Thermomicrobiales bacterium]MEA2586521.1 peptide/nickel transport system permease protein [Thermomicrobiales bacterium]MEA2595474.1 peptide/nickel transport system permease protein [Thermomicrobiales bacterium]